MNKQPFFSVVIPTYNQDELLKKALNSVIAQKENYEIIVIDNFSKDKTEEVVKNYKQKSLKYIKKNNNGVIGISRNEGIKNSNGLWIAFLDSDDFWHDKRLEIIENFLKKHKEYDVLTTDERIVYENNKKKAKNWKYGPYEKNFYKKLILEGNCISTSATVVKKEFLIKNNIFFSEDKKFVTVEDYDFFLNLAFKNAKFKFLHKVLGTHLYHQRSASGDHVKHHDAYKAVFTHHANNIQTFTKDKKKLFKILNCHIAFMTFATQVNLKNNLINAFIILSKNILINPIISLNYLIKRIFLKLTRVNFR